MNEQEQRIAIAEVDGWPSSENNINYQLQLIGGKWWALTLPDYLNDLNAMHEAEKVLDDSYEAMPPRQCVSYAKLLQRIGATTNGGKSEFGVANSTAAQRAEAFLKTLNLWTS
jgi:hypothetical protein